MTDEEKRRQQIREEAERLEAERRRRESEYAAANEREKREKVFESDPWPDPKKKGK